MNLFKLPVILIITPLITAYSCTHKLPEKPNILLITTDYQAWEDLPEITPVLNMPAIDRLYNEGLVFENHYCTAPVCMPSRYTIVSGTYPHTHGLWDNSSKWLPDGTPLLMEELGKAGYRTTGIGKMHFKPWDRMAGFDERIIADCQGNGYRDTTKRDDYYYYLKQAGMTRYDYLRYQDSTDLFGVYYWPFADSLDIDYYVGEQTVRYIEGDKLKEDPWFLWVSFNGPHNPWDPPAEYMDYYLGKELPPARYLENELEKKPFAHTITRYNYTRKVVDRIDMDPDNRDKYIHRIRAGHFGGLSWIDRQVGRIIDKLEEKNKLENTIIIFTSDHGAHLGDHNLIHKGTHYERSSHVPFILWWPEAVKPGRVKGFTSHVDLFPTLLELAGGKLPGGIEGKSYYNLLKGRDSAPDTAIVEILGNTALVTKDYKFGLYRQYREGELYDREKDPEEFNNLFDDPGHGDLVNYLTEYLYSVDPTLQADYENARLIKPFPEKLTLKSGKRAAAENTPYLGGKSFKVSFELNYKNGQGGPLLVHHEGQHGFSFYIENGILYAGFRTWNNDSIFKIRKLSPGINRVVFSLRKDGILKSVINNESCADHLTPWPKPIQAGRKEYLKGIFIPGGAGPGWADPIGSYRQGAVYNGDIPDITIALLN